MMLTDCLYQKENSNNLKSVFYMKLRNIFLIITLIATFISCKKEEIMLFDREETGIYFQAGNKTMMYGRNEVYYDSLSFSFSNAPYKSIDTILSVKIRTMGVIKDYPRPIKLSVDQNKSTAIAGVHYVLDLSKAIIPANGSEINFQVKFLRTQDILDKIVSLILKLEENEHFKLYFNFQKNTNNVYSTGSLIKADIFKFNISEIYTMPSYWSYFGSTYFGTWTVKKYKFVNEVLGWTNDDWQRGGYSDSKVILGRFGVGAFTVRNALQKLANEGKPMLEADGSFMQLGSSYSVDYSAYL